MSDAVHTAVYPADRERRKDSDDVLVLSGRRYEVTRALEEAMPCRKCDASPHEECTTKSGKQTRWLHSVRYTDAVQALDRLWAEAQAGEPL